MMRFPMVLCITAACACTGCAVPPFGAIRLLFDFNDGAQEWQAGIADYSEVDEGNLNFVAEIRPLPDNLESSGTGLLVQSTNTPDDLFTFIKRRLGPEDGLEAGRTYLVRFRITFASNAPSGCAGIGGAPGESVHLKAGATATEPMPVDIGDGEIRMNVDKGNQATGGPAASVAGNVANSIPCEDVPDLVDAPFESVAIEHVHDTLVTADDGVLWLLIGTDSGFEGTTDLYYQQIEVTLTPIF